VHEFGGGLHRVQAISGDRLAVQVDLAERGHPVTVDGISGSKTDAAVRAANCRRHRRPEDMERRRHKPSPAAASGGATGTANSATLGE